MDVTATAISSTLAIFTTIGIGALARWRGWLTEEADQSMMRVVVNLLMPALILTNVIGNPALERSENLLWPPLVGFTTILLGIAGAMVATTWFGKPLGLRPGPRRRTFAVAVGIHNYGYIPVPLVMALYDGPMEAAVLAVLFMHNLGVDFALWTVGVMTLTRKFDRDWWKHALNPPALAIIAGLLINVIIHLGSQQTGVALGLPGFVVHILRMLGEAAIPVGLVLIGATILDQLPEFRWNEGCGMMIGAVGLRLGLLPVAFLVIAAVVPGSDELRRVLAVQAAMPCAVFPIVLARHYRGSPDVAVRVVLATSVLSLLTMPVWLTWGHAWLGF